MIRYVVLCSKTYFICIKQSTLHSPNLPNLPNSPNHVTLAKITHRQPSKSSQTGLANFGESGKYWVNRLANVDQSNESSQISLANVGESSESQIFPKMAILASACTQQKLIFLANTRTRK